jgi:class I fructose-bisphosphate aldolase
MVVFSGGGKKGEDAILEEARAIKAGGGNGSIIGRNSFQRSKEDALELLSRLIEIYRAP